MSRECGECTLCCGYPLMPVPRCEHVVSIGGCGGCGIYEDRPEACRTYQCSWLRGIGTVQDQPLNTNLVIDKRFTQFGYMLVARQSKEGAARTSKGKSALVRAVKESDLPLLITSYTHPDRVIGVLGSKEIHEEIKKARIDGMVYVGKAPGYTPPSNLALGEGTTG